MDTGSMVFIGVSVGVGLLMLISMMSMISRCYRRCGADEALVRTGSGGNKVVIGGGVLVFPVLHQLLRVSLRSVKLNVEREGKNALVTGDKIKANVTTELYIKVQPLAEDVLAAARSFGDRNLDEKAIGALIEGKLTDALRSVAAVQTFMSLHAKRKEFAEHIQAALAEELKKNGLTLENVSITSFAMVPVRELDEHDVFDAEGLRAITESVQSNREKDNQIHAQNVTARMRQLELEQQQKQAEADQSRRVSEYAAAQNAETAKAVYVQEQTIAVALASKQRAEREAQIAAEKGQQVATIDRDKIVQAAEIDRQKALEAATIEKEKVVGAALIAKEQAIEVARISKEIAVTQSEEQQARAQVARALAEAEEEKAKQSIATVEATARAQREKAQQVIQAEAEGDKQRIAAEARAAAALKEAEAIVTLANAVATKGTAEAEARRKMVEAENTLALKFVIRDVVLRAIEQAPEVARELMEPAKAIKEIRVLQTPGFTAAGQTEGARPALGAMSPILKTLLEAGAAYPMMRELMTFAKADPDKLGEKAQAALGQLTEEIGAVLNKEEAAVNGAAAPKASSNGTSHARGAEALPGE
jgi:uncharacterized membrane protein YqiK